VKPALTEEVKVRVPLPAKEKLQALADQREISVSDIVREALREYLGKRDVPLALSARGGGK
jgi:predicted transcriptional regulator